MRPHSLAALCAVLAAACAPAPTQLVVVVDTDLAIPSELDEISVEVTGPGGMRQTETAALASESVLPLTLGVAPSGDVLGPIDVVAVGSRRGMEVVRRRHRVTLVRGESHVLAMHLVRACIGASCGTSETCGANGGCEPIEVEASSLPRWSGTPPRLGARADAGVDRDAAPVDGGGSDGSTGDGGSSDGGSSDGGAMPDAGLDGGPPPCPSPTTECSGACVDTGIDEAHCGACGVTCTMARTCIYGACSFYELMHWFTTARRTGRMCGSTWMDVAPDLVPSAELEAAALRHANDMAAGRFLSVMGSDGSFPLGRASDAGYTGSLVHTGVFEMGRAETIEEVVDQMLAMPTLCAQIMAPTATQMGAAGADGAPSGFYWEWYLARP